MKAIIYTSNTGSTERYARLLEQTGLPAYSLTEAVKGYGAAASAWASTSSARCLTGTAPRNKHLRKTSCFGILFKKYQSRRLLIVKRENYISWDEYFMGIAMLAARRSKDPNTQVGACIVSKDNIILSTGYNGMPKGCSDDEYPWDREGADTKYPYVVHAELNAILNAHGRDLQGSRLYVALFPCNECAKAIIQSGVQEVLYLSDKYNDTLNNLASKRMLQAAGVKFTQLKFCRRQIVLDFVAEEGR